MPRRGGWRRVENSAVDDPLWISDPLILRKPRLDPKTCRNLHDCYGLLQERNLRFFLSLRAKWLEEHPDRRFPGLCADVNPLTGEFRRLEEQRHWGWGDGRALSTWSIFLLRNRVPCRKVVLRFDGWRGPEVGLRDGLEEYLRVIYSGMLSRMALNGDRKSVV